MHCWQIGSRPVALLSKRALEAICAASRQPRQLRAAASPYLVSDPAAEQGVQAAQHNCRGLANSEEAHRGRARQRRAGS